MNSISLVLVLVSVLALSCLVQVDGRLREGECEVCLKKIGEMSASLSKLKSGEEIENGIKKLCRSYKDHAEKRFCYYIGGSDDAATSLLRTISGPMKNHMPAEKICEKLKSADGQICQVKYEKPKEAIDWSSMDLNKLRVKELKDILTQWGEKCEGCNEKGDIISLIKTLLPKHVPGATLPHSDL
jgi:hypothetical protein